MLVFKILVVCALILCVVNLLFGIHTMIVCNKMINSCKNWAYEIDKNNNQYIQQQFARLKYENGLVLDNNNNDKKEN